ncbi:carboxymuconolactone decarboxylase family protein [Myxococcota bacterium]|nr:carboxymuconolactone decarboxylase family protein [Myxococcota bacterium]
MLAADRRPCKATQTDSLSNGCTLQELEEVIYHATAYAGFPAANGARAVATESFRKQGLVD